MTYRNKYSDYLTKILQDLNDSEMSHLSDRDSGELDVVMEKNMSEDKGNAWKLRSAWWSLWWYLG